MFSRYAPLVALCVLVGHPVHAQATLPLSEPTIEYTANDVQRLVSTGSTKKVAINASFKSGERVTTGKGSRLDLSFSDKTLVRVGSTSEFTLDREKRVINVKSGTFVLTVPDNAEAVTIQTGLVRTTIKGGTFIIRQDATVAQVFALTDQPGGVLTLAKADGSEPVTLKGGQLALVNDDKRLIRSFDLGEFLRTAPLLNTSGSASLQTALNEVNQGATTIAQNQQAQGLVPVAASSGSSGSTTSSTTTASTATASTATTPSTGATSVIAPPTLATTVTSSGGSVSTVQSSPNFLNELLATPQTATAFNSSLNGGVSGAAADIADALSKVNSIGLTAEQTLDAIKRLTSVRDKLLPLAPAGPLQGTVIGNQILACIQLNQCP